MWYKYGKDFLLSKNENVKIGKANADIIGLLVGQEHSSTDFISKEKEITDYVDGKCDVSLVTHLTNANEIIDLTRYIGNNIIQLHSDIDETELKK